MTYAVISNWTSTVSIQSTEGDPMRAMARDRFAPGVIALGALNVYFIAITDTSFHVVTIYPDEAAAVAATERQNAIRGEAAAALPVRMVSDVRGNVFASQ